MIFWGHCTLVVYGMYFVHCEKWSESYIIRSVSVLMTAGWGCGDGESERNKVGHDLENPYLLAQLYITRN